MHRFVVLTAFAALVVIAPFVSAQGLLDIGFSRLGDVSGVDYSLGRDIRIQPFSLYTGFTSDPANAMRFTMDGGINGVAGAQYLQHGYTLRGLWLGAVTGVRVSAGFRIIGSYWHFSSLKTPGDREEYNYFTTVYRDWSSDTEWRFADVFCSYEALDDFTVLFGFRHDYFTTAFSDPKNVTNLGTDDDTTADLTAESYMPLIGGQATCSLAGGSLFFRAVGSPVVPGRLRYIERFGVSSALRASGSYRSGYYLEAIMEYGIDFGGFADMSLFGRYIAGYCDSDVFVDFVTSGAVVDTGMYHQTLSRNSWTVGLRFDLKY